MQRFKKILAYLFDFAMFINICALIPQLVTILMEKSAKGVSIVGYSAFLGIQICFALHGKLNLNSRSMFFGMLVSALISATTIVLCIIYK